jgi:NAD-dependent DNA ligase
MFDTEASRLISRNPHVIVPWILMAAYAYYIEDSPILSDGFFDALCRQLSETWDEIRHRHKFIIDRRSLRKSSSLHYLGVDDFPNLAIDAAKAKIEEIQNDRADKRKRRRERRRLRQRH